MLKYGAKKIVHMFTQEWGVAFFGTSYYEELLSLAPVIMRFAVLCISNRLFYIKESP